MSEYDYMIPTAQLVMEVDGKVFYPELVDNTAAREFFDRLKPQALCLNLEDRTGIEKSGRLPWSLSSDGTRSDASLGDIFLRGEDEIAVCLGQGIADVVRIASLGYAPSEDIVEAFGGDSVPVSFWLEWSERRSSAMLHSVKLW